MDPEDRLDEDFMFYLSVSERNWKNLKTEEEKELTQVPPEFKKIDKTEDLTTTYKSKDGRTYVATKSLGKDHGAYTYIGISLADKEPLWVGGDAPAGPCYAFERHFEKPRTLYSKCRPRSPGSIFTMEKEGGSGDSPDDTKIFTDYVTGARVRDVQMSGTHSEGFRPSSLKKGFRLSEVGARKSWPTSAYRSKDGAEKAKRASDSQAEKLEHTLASEPWEGLDTMYPLTEEGDVSTTEPRLDLSEFYDRMITNIDNSLIGLDELNEYNKEKADEIMQLCERENNQIDELEALNRMKEALINKLSRVKNEESRVHDDIHKLEYVQLSDTEDSVIQAWKAACKNHDEKNLQLLEEVYNTKVRERMADMMTALKLRAVEDRGEHMKEEAAAVREDFKRQKETIEIKTQGAEELMEKTNFVIDQAEALKTAAPRDNNYFEERRELAEKLLAEVEQLIHMYHVEDDACRSLEHEIANTSVNVFSNPELMHLIEENDRLKHDIAEKQAHLGHK
ncbi:uncharacterized protein LOC126344411 isoform X2 [Schistocerca gregaria]|uniref:uncharacterized protein LOC126344411 isoform X2 n=1 Tax=Schistocerca gregaria TaxID=7010 RepID=UPI00211DEA95|nr:uncharacterized protein LOC126344411 isoform X2 [Schistocerca gregaria]